MRMRALFWTLIGIGCVWATVFREGPTSEDLREYRRHSDQGNETQSESRPAACSRLLVSRKFDAIPVSFQKWQSLRSKALLTREQKVKLESELQSGEAIEYLKAKLEETDPRRIEPPGERFTDFHREHIQSVDFLNDAMNVEARTGRRVAIDAVTEIIRTPSVAFSDRVELFAGLSKVDFEAAQILAFEEKSKRGQRLFQGILNALQRNR